MHSMAEMTMHEYSVLSAPPLVSISSRMKVKYLTASEYISSCLYTSAIFLTKPDILNSVSSRYVRKAKEKCWKALLLLPRRS